MFSEHHASPNWLFNSSQEPSQSPLGCQKDHKQLCLRSSSNRLNPSILWVSRSRTHPKHPTQTMTPKHLLFSLPVQALMLLASAAQAQNYAYPPEPPTAFLPENHTGIRCVAWSPGCMKRSEWAKLCSSKHPLVDPNSKSCRDALGVRPINYRPYLPQPRNMRPAPPIRLPNLKTGVTCLALSEACMSREDWAKVCASASNPAQLGCKPSSL